jgi:RHS repeat-associated protein
MQAQTSIRMLDTFMTPPVDCLLSAASAHSSISTGKERDAESGNDYFGARYYASTMGRWLSPDWSAKVMPVPYAKLDDPQSLNLYSYVENNPLARLDADGHLGCKDTPQLCKAIRDAVSSGMEAGEAMRSSAQKFLNQAGSYFYAKGFKGSGDEVKVGVKGVVTIEAGHKEGTEVTRHLNGDREEKQIKSNLHFKLEIAEKFSFGLERTVEGEDSKPKWQFSGGREGVEGSSGGQVGVTAGFCHGTCSSIEGGVEAGKAFTDLMKNTPPPQPGSLDELMTIAPK